MKEKNIHTNSKLETRNSQPATSRRSFLKRIWGILGIVAGIEMLAVFSGFFAPGKRNLSGTTQTLVVAGNVADFKLNSVFPFRSGKFYLARFSDGGFMAISLKCTHLGCSVLWNEDKKEFMCPCHASSFDKNGVVINPPAPRPLDTFPVIIEEGKVKVDIGKPVRRLAFDRSQITYA
ncbi:MAG: ubiquinol-cytochrome c reductase iron-sulfur subunit [Bacteroidales bacterium]|nr:ubiquinol-cytochrome c reductase iron-sulfur subunit [Bacteroidales bacterium]